MSNVKTINRRDFLQEALCVMSCMAAGYPLMVDKLLADDNPAYIKPAKHWEKLPNGAVQCRLCPNECLIEHGETGACRVRRNIKGSLYTLVYGRLAAMHIDPIEKKPLFHFLPGSRAFSVATAGCNLSCRFCQNWQLSQSEPDDLSAQIMSPRKLCRQAVSGASPVIAFTYNEPTVQYEYIIDVAHEARKRNIKSVIISNGYINKEPGKKLAGVLDAIKVDLKAFTNDFYQKICGGDLKSVLNNLEVIHASGRWLELVVLVIPTLNDDTSEIRRMAQWVRKHLSADVPMHFTRFHSMYLMRNLPSTPVSTLERCRTIAVDEGINYAYVGNVPGHKWENTYCHSCGKVLIDRSGFFVSSNRVKGGRCSACGTVIPGVWS